MVFEYLNLWVIGYTFFLSIGRFQLVPSIEQTMLKSRSHQWHSWITSRIKASLQGNEQWLNRPKIRIKSRLRTILTRQYLTNTIIEVYSTMMKRAYDYVTFTSSQIPKMKKGRWLFFFLRGMWIMCAPTTRTVLPLIVSIQLKGHDLLPFQLEQQLSSLIACIARRSSWCSSIILWLKPI